MSHSEGLQSCQGRGEVGTHSTTQRRVVARMGSKDQYYFPAPEAPSPTTGSASHHVRGSKTEAHLRAVSSSNASSERGAAKLRGQAWGPRAPRGPPSPLACEFSKHPNGSSLVGVP